MYHFKIQITYNTNTKLYHLMILSYFDYVDFHWTIVLVIPMAYIV